MASIVVDSLTKTYGETVGVESLSFAVERGEIFGFLGPNGAGKTTTIRTILGLIAPTAGNVRVFDVSVRDRSALTATKAEIGYVPAEIGFPEDVTGNELLDYHAAVKGDSRRGDLLERFSPPLERPIREYSSGNAQQLAIIQAFMHDPALVVLDEPTSGLDPLKQEQFNEFLRAERDRGTTIFFSSHILSEVRHVCDRVGILRDGSLVALESMETLLDGGGKRVHVQTETGDPTPFKTLEGAFDVTTVGSSIRCTYAGPYDRLLETLADCSVQEIEIREPPLEDIFMHFYGNDDTEATDV
ncbi:ABC transporter ATP-binding protein [Halocatena halophila]|uniref:ABC transporter ATP-binding protein n=1 Tax=Halocatena halophila TaxID=2814576 RepID=UPI002ED13431